MRTWTADRRDLRTGLHLALARVTVNWTNQLLIPMAESAQHRASSAVAVPNPNQALTVQKHGHCEERQHPTKPTVRATIRLHQSNGGSLACEFVLAEPQIFHSREPP